MGFFIQVSNPKPTATVVGDDSTLAEVIEGLFPLATEFAMLMWNGVYVPITYKHDISLMIDDIMHMVHSLKVSPTGLMTIDWPSNNFCARWVVRWTEVEVFVSSDWKSVIGGTEQLLNSVPTIQFSKAAFVAEWMGVLSMVQRCLGSLNERGQLSVDLFVLSESISDNNPKGYLYNQ